MGLRTKTAKIGTAKTMQEIRGIWSRAYWSIRATLCRFMELGLPPAGLPAIAQSVVLEEDEPDFASMLRGPD
jgi:hypothetical protein